MADIKTVTLTGGEVRVTIERRHCHIRNLGNEMIYASLKSGIVPEDDGVLGIPAGAKDVLTDTDGYVYLKGTGKVQVVGSKYADGILGGLAGGDITAAVAAAVAKIVAGAPADFDTLKEISDWIYSHSDSAAEMNSEIQALKTNKADKTELPIDYAFNKVLSTLDAVNNPNLESGIYSVEDVPITFPFGESSYFALIVNRHKSFFGFGIQLAVPHTDVDQKQVYYRLANDETWSDWISLADGGNSATVNNKHVEINAYLNPGSFGMSASTNTANEMWENLPSGSIFMIPTQLLEHESWNFVEAGIDQQHSTLLMFKSDKNRPAGIYVYHKTSGAIWYSSVDQNGNLLCNWARINDGGNAYTLNGYSATQIANNPNLLINPDFRINQREKTGVISDMGYFVDRWQLVSGTVEITSDGIVLNGTIKQILENAVDINVTASASAGTATYDNNSKTFTLAATGEVIAWAKLEIGSIATSFVPPDYTIELLKCKRYYQVFRNYVKCCYFSEKFGCFFALNLSPKMRITPTLTIPDSDIICTTAKVNQTTTGWKVYDKYSGGQTDEIAQLNLTNADSSLYNESVGFVANNSPVHLDSEIQV